MLHAGAPIGTATLDASHGLACGRLVPAGGYAAMRSAAEFAGSVLARPSPEWRHWPASRGDFAEAFAASLAGGYELTDARGMPVWAASVAVFALPHERDAPTVVADFRTDASRAPARLRYRSSDDGARHDPDA